MKTIISTQTLLTAVNVTSLFLLLLLLLLLLKMLLECRAALPCKHLRAKNYKYVGPHYCRAEMYAGRIV